MLGLHGLMGTVVPNCLHSALLQLKKKPFETVTTTSRHRKIYDTAASLLFEDVVSTDISSGRRNKFKNNCPESQKCKLIEQKTAKQRALLERCCD